MTEQSIQFEGGDVLANLEERTITGLLIPFNEVGRTNVGRFMVEAGAVELPADPAVIGLNLDHDRTQNVGRAVRVWQEDRGVMATFAIVKTPEGDAALADALNPNGKRRKLSGEFGPAVIKAGKLVAGHAKAWGSALVEAGAFPSAQVLAADTPDADPAPPAEESAEHVALKLDAVPEDITVVTPDGDETVFEPAAAPAEEPNPTTEGGSNVTATANAGAPAPAAQPAAQVLASVPPTMNPGAAPATTQPVNETAQVLAALSSLRANPRDAEAMQVLAAIADVTMSGTNTLPGSGVLRPNWLGKLYQGIPYLREYITLGTLGTDISAAGKLAMRVVRNTTASPQGPQDGSWLGNKNAINGYRGDSSTVGSLLYRFAVGNDIDRSLYDLPGGVEVVEEFLKLIIEDHLFWSDRIARETFIAAAGVPVAAATYPAIYTTNGTTALAMVIQGILAVKKRKWDQRRDVPTFAILNDRAFEQVAYAAGGEQNLPEFLEFALASLDLPQSEIGTAAKVKMVNGDTGVSATASVVVGAGLAVDFDELAGGPLQIDAIDLAKGGIDKATHGYLQTFVKRSEAIVHVGTADSWAATTPIAVGTPIKNGAGTLQAQPNPTSPVGAATAGTTGGSAPTNPAVGATVVDGTVTWKRLA